MKRQRIKPILPTLKEKKRYLVFHILSDSSFNDAKKVNQSFNTTFLSLLGTFGYADANIEILNDCFNQEAQKGIIKLDPRYLSHVKASLAFINSIDKVPVSIKSLGVSGILNKAKKRYISN